MFISLEGPSTMLKSYVTMCFFIVFLVTSMTSQASASFHSLFPSEVENKPVDFTYYENKQTRCLDAFARSDFEIAFAICTPLANLGFKDAQLVTGLLYAYGEGVDKDLHRAKIWLREALKNGRGDAARALAEFGME